MSPLCVFISSSVPPGIRGAMNQWLLEVLPGVFVGRISARIRDYLWQELAQALPAAEGSYAALIKQSDEMEQGFSVDTVGDYRYEIEDFAGLFLVTRTRKLLPEVDFPDGLPDPSW